MTPEPSEWYKDYQKKKALRLKGKENKMTEFERSYFEMHRKEYEKEKEVIEKTIEEKLKKGHITDEEADIKLRKIEERHEKEDFAYNRPVLSERWDLLPACALREVAEIMYKGLDKHPKDNWKDVDFTSDQSPLNRAIAHAYKATEELPQTSKRIRLLAKATCRLLMQLWWELQEFDGPHGVTGTEVKDDN